MNIDFLEELLANTFSNQVWDETRLKAIAAWINTFSPNHHYNELTVFIDRVAISDVNMLSYVFDSNVALNEAVLEGDVG